MGHIGHRHALAYTESDKAELVAVCDRVPELAKAAGEKFGVPYFTNAAEMFAALKPDLCSVTTGGYEYASDHYEPTIQAFEAGCHVLGEKPISNNLKHAVEMVELAEKNASFVLQKDSERIALQEKKTKGALQEILQGKGEQPPVYETVKSGKDNAPTFVATVVAMGETATGEGGSKKEAEQQAAQRLLAKLQGKN
jgi:hypothetical protein